MSREFIEKFLVWQRGSNVLETQNCMVLNFGFDGEIPYPQLRLSSQADIGEKLFWRTNTFRSPNTCSIVIIGSRNLDKVSDIMKVVDGITENLQMMPFVTFLEVNEDDLENTVDINDRHNISPTMVNFLPRDNDRDSMRLTSFKYFFSIQILSTTFKILGEHPNKQVQRWRLQVRKKEKKQINSQSFL